MRIATWNVNSVRARIDRVVGWVERGAAPDRIVASRTQETIIEEMGTEPAARHARRSRRRPDQDPLFPDGHS